jgi:hypothetical protein
MMFSTMISLVTTSEVMPDMSHLPPQFQAPVEPHADLTAATVALAWGLCRSSAKRRLLPQSGLPEQKCDCD